MKNPLRCNNNIYYKYMIIIVRMLSNRIIFYDILISALEKQKTLPTILFQREDKCIIGYLFMSLEFSFYVL